ncbi:magnesium transporter [Dokdonia sp. Hel_I_63]|jgi:magnesium transporter|uniref:magnesium transporter n=1 Tax=unclassified Dokdonia TaxID=2615033 RepID=UPI000D545862|nr:MULTISPECIES: magnesium transporter [unclassified Dokdonia]AWH73924.1 magnesium transporter [Dokdonia sp. Dokd-P16]TVZ21803.1 magnesium transporter [Dokdonia sp. Hel_I_63]|tara:strand:+ start:115271 stop:116620 length:1350 start_codon:yes stop_codon:yes gene_type:complete
MQFELTSDLIDQIQAYVAVQNETALKELLSELHHADIAEVLDEVDADEAAYLVLLLDSEQTSEALMELDEDVREKLLGNLTPAEIADEVDEMDTDDAVDMIAELDDDVQLAVINQIEDEEHKADIREMLQYDENSAGGLMAKELIRVKDSWTVGGCVSEMRRQAEEVTRVHSIYVVTKRDELIGRLSLKDLLTSDTKTKIAEIYIPKVDSVNINDSAEDVAKLMQKYDLEAIPVVNDKNILMGRITIDDIVDFIKEEAEKDYQMAAGISQDVEADDSILTLTRARLPWLFLGLVGGVGAATIMGGFEDILESYALLFFYTPLIAAMAGNVGVQSSAIIVQGLANDDVKGSIGNRLVKEMLLAALNGLLLGLALFAFTALWYGDVRAAIAISASLFVVIIMAGIIGTFIPLFLHKRGIDPAIATGPFITTSNDIFGILIYFWIAKMVLGI